MDLRIKLYFVVNPCIKCILIIDNHLSNKTNFPKLIFIVEQIHFWVASLGTTLSKKGGFHLI